MAGTVVSMSIACTLFVQTGGATLAFDQRAERLPATYARGRRRRRGEAADVVRGTGSLTVETK